MGAQNYYKIKLRVFLNKFFSRTPFFKFEMASEPKFKRITKNGIKFGEIKCTFVINRTKDFKLYPDPDAAFSGGSPSYLWGIVKTATIMGDPEDSKGFTMGDYRILSSKLSKGSELCISMHPEHKWPAWVMTKKWTLAEIQGKINEKTKKSLQITKIKMLS